METKQKRWIQQKPIPPAFTKNFNGEIPHWLIIERAGTRKCWRVDVEDDGNGMFRFTDGWDDFVEANSLELGTFLVFQYKEELIIEVTIYDKDGSEKTASQTSEFKEYEVEEMEHQCGTSNTCHEESASLDMILADRSGAQEKLQQVVGSIKRRKMARALIIGDGVGFSITWRDQMKNYYYYLTIPRQVVLKKKLSSHNGVVLKDKEGNSWLVKLTIRSDGRVDLTHGWREFLNANKITVGDTLTFDFLSENLIQVHVESPSRVDHPSQSAELFRNELNGSLNIACEDVEPIANCTPIYRSTEASENTEQDSPEFRSSSFSTTCTESTRSTYLHIPMRVAKEQKLHDKKTIVLCDEEGKHWELGLRIRRSDGRFTLARGWSEFWRRNEIAVGDTLVFEFVSQCMMKVKITRASRVHHAVKEVAFKQEMVGI